MRKTLTITTLILLSSYIIFAQANYDNIKSLVNSKDYEKAASLIPEAVKNSSKDTKLLMLSGEVYLELDRNQEAYEMYKKANENEGNKPHILKMLGRSLSLIGKHGEASQVLRKAIKNNQKDQSLYLELGNALIRADSLAAAELVITQARELDKNSPDAFIALGNMYFAQRVYELAKNNYEQALALNENLLEARIKLATAYYWLATYEVDKELANTLFARSLKEWISITNKDPKNSKAFFEQGKIFFYSRKYRESANALIEFVKLNPKGSLGRWFLAQSFYELGYCDSAAPHLEIVSKEIDSVKIKAKLLLARCFFDQKKLTQSLTIFNEVKSQSKLEVIDLNRMASAYFNTHDTISAIGVWKEVIELAPAENCRLMFSLGSLLQGMKKYDEAIEVLTKRNNTVQCNDSVQNRIYYLIGLCHQFAGRPQEAVPSLKKSVELNPKFLYAHVYLGDAYAAIDSLELAEQEFQYVIDNGAADTLTNKGALTQAFFKICSMKLDKKDYSQLLKVAKSWISVLPNDSYPYIYAAYGAQGSNERDAACGFYKKALAIDPKNDAVRKNYNALCGQ